MRKKLLILLRQGKISKWFSGIGQEAISIGVTLALKKDEYILPMHRNLGVFTARDIPLHRLFSQWQGKANGFTKGRDRSFHFGTQEYHIVGMIFAFRSSIWYCRWNCFSKYITKKTKRFVPFFTGDGGTSEGDFHEALNVASVWNLPVLFCIENNGYGLSTPVSEQFNCKNLADKGIGYGMESHIIDGNNIVEVYSKISKIANSVRKKPRPVFKLNLKTFRMRGHEEASGTKYIPKELMEEWAKKDPIANFKNYLLHHHILTEKSNTEYQTAIKEEIESHLKMAYAEENIIPNVNNELQDVYKHFDYKEIAPCSQKKKIRFVDAVSQSLRQSMEKYSNLVIMGQDIAEYGGVFKITEGFVDLFGKERVRNYTNL